MTAAKPLTRDEVACWGFGSGHDRARILATIDALAAAESARDKFADDLYAEQAEHTAAVTRAETAERERDEARHHADRLTAEVERQRESQMALAKVSVLRATAEGFEEDRKKAVAERDALTQALAARDEAIAELNRELDASVADGVAQITALTAQVAAQRELLKRVQHLVDDADQGPRAVSGDGEWRIPWTRYAVEVFTDVARALATKPPTADVREKP